LPASDWLLSGVEDDSDTAQPAEALDEEELEDELEEELEDEPMSEEEAGTEGATISHGKRASARTPSDEDAGGQA
jgi:hypothetical protein